MIVSSTSTASSMAFERSALPSLEYEVDYLQNKCTRLEAARRAVLKTTNKEAVGTPGSAESQGLREARKTLWAGGP